MDSPINDLQIGKITESWAQYHDIATHYTLQCESTNTWAKNKAFDETEKSEALTIYLSEHQTAGRGRGKNHWNSPRPGSALLSSWSFQVDFKPQPIVTIRAGLALIRSVMGTWPFLDWSLKAPNDLYLGKKKVAGLLLETVNQGDEDRLIIGLGMNLFDSPKEVSHSTSIAHSLPAESPLLGSDYVGFLDRFLFEVTDALRRSTEPLDETERTSVRHYLNLFPLLEAPYDSVGSDGTLTVGSKTTNWSEL